MADTPRHSVSVAGIVIDDAGRVLVIQRRDNGHWEPPGGILELSEQFEDGVHREVLEETGLDVQVDRLTGVYKNLNLGVVALVFRCTPARHRPPRQRRSHRRPLGRPRRDHRLDGPRLRRPRHRRLR